MRELAGVREYLTPEMAAVLSAVVDGSRTAPQDIEDFWTFTRPVGNNPWKLSAIQSA